MVECPDCPGCRDNALYPHQHATPCPVFKHADVRQEADFLMCGCGQHCVNYADHFEHLRTVWRNRQFELIDAGLT